MSATAVPEPLRLVAPERPRGRRLPWVPLAAALVLGLIAAALTAWARTRPGFDPYGWLVWGNQTVFGHLDTNAAPSWKPLPYLFTVPFAVARAGQVYLWLWWAVAVSLSGLAFAYRIAHRLTLAAPGAETPASPRRRHAALAAGFFAAVALLGIQGYPHYILSAQSDPMIVALCLGAVDCALRGRARSALTLGLLAALGRPEVWPLLGLYAVWCWRTIPAMRWLIVTELVILLVLWFGIPALSSRSPFVAGDNALGSSRAIHGDRVFGTIGRFLRLHAWPLEVTALGSTLLAARRRDRTVLLLAGGVVVWVAVEVAFALHGWPGLPRYMFEAAGVTVVLAGVLVGRLAAGDLTGRLSARPARGLGVALAVLAVGALGPTAVSAVRTERTDLRVQRLRTTEINRLSATIQGLGGARRLHPCGEALISLQWQSVLAWRLHLNVARIGWKFPRAVHSGRPIVLFALDRAGTWQVRAVHQRRAGCLGLPS